MGLLKGGTSENALYAGAPVCRCISAFECVNYSVTNLYRTNSGIGYTLLWVQINVLRFLCVGDGRVDHWKVRSDTSMAKVERTAKRTTF